MSFKHLILIGFFSILISSCNQNKSQSINYSNNTIKEDAFDTLKFADSIVLNAEYESKIKSLPPALAQFVPRGYEILDTASGNLNFDKFTDMILVLKRMGEISSHEDSNRPLLILEGQPDKSYKLAANSDNIVYCYNCGGAIGDPYQGISVEDGEFSISFYGGGGLAERWRKDFLFKYDRVGNEWHLNSFTDTEYQKEDITKIKNEKLKSFKDFGKIPLDEINIYDF